MTRGRYRQLQDLVRQYTEETGRFTTRAREIGFAIVEAYDAWLGAPGQAVYGVPPFDPFEPRVPYREAMFSSYTAEALTLGPIHMGLSTEIAGKSDEAAIWVRTVIEFRPIPDGLELLIGDRQRRVVLVPGSGAALQTALADICEAIYEDVREVFSLDLNEARGAARVGFVAPDRA